MEGPLHIAKYEPRAELRPYVKNYCIFELQNIDQLQYVPAWAKTMFIFHYGDRFSFRMPDGREWWTTGASIMGSSTVPLSYGRESGLRMKFFTVELYPLVLKALVGGDVAEFTDHTIELDDVFGKHGADLIPEALAEASGDRARVEIVETYLLKRFGDLRFVPDDRMRAIVDRIYREKGAVDMGALARELGYTDRHLRRVFKRSMGMGPKKYSLLVRAEFILNRLFQDSDTRLSDLALEFGYFDQAHFINEFKNTTLATPREMTRDRYLETVRFFYT